MSIVAPDPYQSLHEFEQSQNPDYDIAYQPIERWKVRAIDDLVGRARGADVVKTEKDWNLVAGCVVFYIKVWPQEWTEFKKSVDNIRVTRGSGGYSKSREFRYVGALPPRLERIIKTCFPNQGFDKTFVNKFVKKFQAFKVGGERN